MDCNLIEDFNFLDTWEEKYEYIIDLGKQLEPIDDNYKTDDNLVQGCMSKVWLVPTVKGDKLYFLADSDAIIVKGLIAIILMMYNGKSKKDILETDAKKILKEIGLDKNLAASRRNGISSMINKIRFYASK